MNRKFLTDTLRPRLVSKQAPLGSPGFAPVVSDTFKDLKLLPQETKFEAGQTLVEQGSQVTSVWIIRSGLVKLSYGTTSGRDSTLGVRTMGWCAGGVWALSHRPCIYSVVAVTPCTASCIPASEFANRLMQSAKLMRHFMQTLCQESISQAVSQAQIMSWSAEERLQQCLEERESKDDMQTVDIIPILKQAELANLLSITPEHLSRLMRKASITANQQNVPCEEKSA